MHPLPGMEDDDWDDDSGWDAHTEVLSDDDDEIFEANDDILEYDEIIEPTKTEPSITERMARAAAEEDALIDEFEDEFSAPGAPSRDWWSKYKEKRAGQETLWGNSAEGKRGAAGITSWMSGGNANYSYGYSSNYSWSKASEDEKFAITLNRALDFARDMGKLAGRDAVQEIGWKRAIPTKNGDGEEYSPHQIQMIRDQRKLPDSHLQLNPEFARKMGEAGGPVDQMEVNSIIAGQALHDGGHIRHSNRLQMADQFRGMRYSVHGANKLTDEQLVQIGYLTEDAYVEGAVLEEYPGFQDYLDSHWRGVKSMDQVRTDQGAASAKWDISTALPLVQEYARRYDDFTEEEQRHFHSLPKEAQGFLNAAASIMERAHQPNQTVKERTKNATELLDLILNGQIPPADQQPGEPNKIPAPGGDLEDALNKMPTHNGDGGEGDDSAGLTDKEAEAAEAEGRLERSEIHNIWPKGYGIREIVVTMLTPDKKNPQLTQGQPGVVERYNQSLRAVEPHVNTLSKALHFRNSTPSRQIGAQIRGRLDDRRLAYAGATAAIPGPKRAFKRKEILAAPNVGIELLIDISGSTHSDARTGSWAHSDSKTRADMFRECAVMMDAALRKLAKDNHDSVDFMIHAHTSKPSSEEGKEEECMILRLKDEKRDDPELLGFIHPTGNNYDSEAIKATGEMALKKWENRQKIMFYLNDGQPAGYNYGQQPAWNRTRDITNELRKKGLMVITIFVGHCSSNQKQALNHMYGTEGDGWISVKDATDLPGVMSRLLRKHLYWKA